MLEALSSESLDSSNLKKLYLLNSWIAVLEVLSSESLDSSVRSFIF